MKKKKKKEFRQFDCVFKSRFSLICILYYMAGAVYTGLVKSTCLLVFSSASGCRASENLDDFQFKLTIFHICQ